MINFAGKKWVRNGLPLPQLCPSTVRPKPGSNSLGCVRRESVSIDCLVLVFSIIKKGCHVPKKIFCELIYFFIGCVCSYSSHICTARPELSNHIMILPSKGLMAKLQFQIPHDCFIETIHPIPTVAAQILNTSTWFSPFYSKQGVEVIC